MKKLAVVLRVVVPLAIIGWLLSAIEPQQRAELWEREKNWGTLCLALLGLAFIVCLTFFRWYLLVRALQLPFRLRDAFRLGFLTYLLNFVSFGSSGGDLFKAIFIAREQPGRRTEAVATIVVDRLLGVYALLLLTAAAIVLIDIPNPSPTLTAICRLTFLTVAAVTTGVLVLLIPGFTTGPLAKFFASWPYVGPTFERVATSVRMYRSRLGLMCGLLGMSMIVHFLLPVITYSIATSLFRSTPGMSEHFVIVPLANVVGALPFTPAGLGSFEFAMEKLYELVPKGGPGDVVGVLVALTYRLLTIVVAAVGALCFWSWRTST